MKNTLKREVNTYRAPKLAHYICNRGKEIIPKTICFFIVSQRHVRNTYMCSVSDDQVTRSLEASPKLVSNRRGESKVDMHVLRLVVW